MTDRRYSVSIAWTAGVDEATVMATEDADFEIEESVFDDAVTAIEWLRNGLPTAEALVGHLRDHVENGIFLAPGTDTVEDMRHDTTALAVTRDGETFFSADLPAPNDDIEVVYEAEFGVYRADGGGPPTYEDSAAVLDDALADWRASELKERLAFAGLRVSEDIQPFLPEGIDEYLYEDDRGDDR